MTKPHNGGPAYPAIQANGRTIIGGMSLRDYFAGQALRARWGDGTAMTPDDAANMAYQLADAMLRAREE